MNDQTVVKIDVNGKFYPISCKIGEEDRVIASGELLSEIISSLDNQDNINSSFGIGIDYYSPIGPLSFSFAQPITKNSSDITETFRFNIGTSF